MVLIPDSQSNHSPSFRVGAKKGHNLTHIPHGRRLSGRSPVKGSGENFQSSVSTRIQIYHYFTYT
jgi:hypothetical protein